MIRMLISNIGGDLHVRSYPSAGVVEIKTIVYFVRHAHSPFIRGMERTRGLSEQGKRDAGKVKEILSNEDIDIFISSPYERAILTIKELAVERNKDIQMEEDLRERRLIGEEHEVAGEQFLESKRQLFEDWNFSFPGGETSNQAQKRAIQVFMKILKQYHGKNIVIGTHGDIMILMMNYYDTKYDYAFWKSTTMPDIYKLEFTETKLTGVERLWK